MILLHTNLTIMIVFLALNNLAVTYENGGKYYEAIMAYEESLVLKRQYDNENLVEMSTSTYMEKFSDFRYL